MNRRRDIYSLRISPDLLWNLSLFVYLCVMFAHQRETAVDTVLRYGSLAFVIAAGVFSYRLQNHKRSGIKLKLGKFELWLTALLVLGGLSSFWSIDSGNVFRALFNLLRISIVCFCIYPHLNSRKALNRLLLLMLGALTYMQLILLVRTPASSWGTERIGAVINQNSNEIGRLTCLGSLLCLYFMGRYKRLRIPLTGLFCLFAAGALLTGSRSAVLILLFQTALYYFLVSGNLKRILAAAGMAAAVYLLFLFLRNNEALYNLIGIRMEHLFQFFTGSSKGDGSIRERLYFMESAWNLFLSHPILGIGLNNFSVYLSSIGYGNAVYSHCGFLEILSTLGITGFLIYYSMYAGVIRRLLRPAFRKDMLAALLLVINLRVLIFEISSISMFTYITYITLMLGLAYTGIRKRRGGVK